MKLRYFLPALTCAAAFAQAPAGTNTDVPEFNDTIRTEVTNIVAPTIVTDKAGNLIDGLQPAQFRLFDNNKEQNIHVDVTFEPISVVVAIQKSSRVESILTQIRRLGSLMPIIVGEHGEAAVIAFDSRIALLQDFTSDSDKIRAAIDKIQAGNSSSRMIDAVDRAVFMLRHRPDNNRKIVLLVSETRDVASEGTVREALINAQLSNVLIYAINISQLAVRLTERPTPPRPDPQPPAAYGNLPAGVDNTPTTIFQNFSPANQAQFVPLLKEIYTQVHGIFVDNPVEVFTKGTGGEQFGFLRLRGLEDAVQRISQEIRSQYLITYSPNNKDEPGFHEIVVTVDNPQYSARTRPGYWSAGGKQ